MKTYICDYATISPTILCDRLLADNTISAFGIWRDLDEDRFALDVDCMFDEEELTPLELARVDAIVKPYLYKG